MYVLIVFEVSLDCLKLVSKLTQIMSIFIFPNQTNYSTKNNFLKSLFSYKLKQIVLCQRDPVLVLRHSYCVKYYGYLHDTGNQCHTESGNFR